MTAHSDFDRATRDALRYAGRDPWPARRAQYFHEALEGIAERLAMTEEQLHARIEGMGLGSMLSAFLHEAFMTESFDGSMSLLAEYVQRRGWQETPRGRRYLEALRDSLPSLYEVVDVQPGAWVDVRDLVRKSPVQRVNEVLGSQSLCRWDRIGGRVLEVNGERIFSGGLLHFPREAADSIQRILLDSIRRFKRTYTDLLEAEEDGKAGSATVAEQILRSSPRAFVQTWIARIIEATNRPRPELHNTDGHPLLLSHARLPLRGSRDEIIARLSALESWQRDPGESRIWHRYGGPLAGASPRKGGRKKRAASAAARAPVKHADDEAPRTITATAELESDTLTVETNSRERMADVMPELQAALGALVGEPLIRYQTAEAALKEPRRAQAPPPDVASSPELAQMLQSFKQQHYRRTLDEKIPMLGNRTPRQCALDPKRRTQVVAWLKDLENGEQRQARGSGQPPFDVQWMWQELGLTKDR